MTKQKYRKREQIKSCQILRIKGEFGYNGQHKRILGVTELFYILIVEVVTKIYICVKIHINAHLKKSVLLHKNSK